MKQTLVTVIALCVAGCSGPPPHRASSADADPSLKPPVNIITPYGNTVSCVAGPGAVCVQR